MDTILADLVVGFKMTCPDAYEEGGRVLLHQAVQRGLLRSMALIADRDAIRCPLGLPANGLHARLQTW